MTKTNTIITIGRQFEAVDMKSVQSLQSITELNCMTKRCSQLQQKRAVSAKNSLNHKTKSLQIASSTPW